MHTLNDPARCEAAHPDDLSTCDGAQDAVRIVDAHGSQAYGCVRHGAMLLASLDGAHVYPGSQPGAACEVHREAARLEPFAFSLPTAREHSATRDLADEIESLLLTWPNRRTPRLVRAAWLERQAALEDRIAAQQPEYADLAYRIAAEARSTAARLRAGVAR